jgi:excalibur calcium-binding domain-containing protein
MKILIAAIAAAIALSATAGADAQVSRDIDCNEVTQAQAQAIFNRDRSDPNDLDRDGDGIACEPNEGVAGISTNRTGTGATRTPAREPEVARQDVGYDAATDRTFQLTISPPRAGDAGLK